MRVCISHTRSLIIKENRFKPKEMQGPLFCWCWIRRGHSSFLILTHSLDKIARRERDIDSSGWLFFCWDKKWVWGNLVTIFEPITRTTSICSGSPSIDLVPIMAIPSPKEEMNLFFLCKHHRIQSFYTVVHIHKQNVSFKRWLANT